MRVDRHFGTVKEASKGGGFVILRDDGRGNAFCSQHEADAAGGLAVGDRVEMHRKARSYSGRCRHVSARQIPASSRGGGEVIKRVRARKRRLLDAAETRKMLRIDADTLDYLQRSGELFKIVMYGNWRPWFRLRDVQSLRNRWRR
jgi:hypothetical protein